MSFFKSTVMASAVVLGAVFAAPANAALSATDSQSFGVSHTTPLSGAVSLSAGLYSLSLNLASTFTNTSKGSSSIGVSIVDALDNVYATLGGGTSGASPNGAFSTPPTINLASGTYYFSWAGKTKFGSTAATATLTGTPLPSPGPIAGAGLPVVLGLMGFAAWRRRQAA